MKIKSTVLGALLRGVPPLLFTLAYAGVAGAQAPAIQIANPCPNPPTVPNTRTYNIQEGTAPGGTDRHIAANALATWSAAAPTTLPSGATACTLSSGTTWNCAGVLVNVPAGPLTQTPNFAGAAEAAGVYQALYVEATNGTGCGATFGFRTVSSGGGWGDPHLTTVDGIHYDFQSAGEFTALREDGFEVQTRQSPVPTATVPITNPYTGITHCVAIYTAVAVKLGSSRVTVQPSPGAEPDPTDMQLRVNGKIVKLGSEPHVLRVEDNASGAIEGTITKHPDGVFEITDARGTQLVVSSNYWNARKVWYLNVNVYATSARMGTMGKIADRSWLPALPDGTSLGPKPKTESERYQVLYEKFADAWRVTKDTTLFDYEDYGTKTEDYTLDEWPRNHPESCALEGEVTAQATTENAAFDACASVVDATRKADCVFDVMITGNPGFGKNYQVTQRFSPVSLGWYSPTQTDVPPVRECPPSKDCPECKDCPETAQPWWCCWTVLTFGIVQIALLIFLALRALRKP